MRASRVLLLFAALLALLLAVASPADAGSLKPFERPIGPQFITGAIVWALLVGLMLLFILYIGVSCISSIERPVRLSAVPLVIAKEY
jgi:hypothetical protein